MKLVKTLPAATGLSLLCLLAFSTIAADQPASPRAQVASVTDHVLTILRDPKLNAEQRRIQVRELAYNYMDFETLSRLSLGRYWRNLTPTQKTQFIEEFKQHLSNTYTHTFDEYHGEDVKITGDRGEPDGDWTVLTQIIGDQNGKRDVLARVDYRLRNRGQWRVIDVTVEGVSLVANFRAQFQSIMAEGGIDRLMKLLHEKNAAGEGGKLQ
jgi:phospholipid transport system substrate-binding protein